MKRYDPLHAPDPDGWLELDEAERLSLVEEYHRRAGSDLPNVTAHALFHVVVENQVVPGECAPVERTLERLLAEGLDRHDALHAIGSVLAAHMHRTLQRPDEPEDPNEDFYRGLDRLTVAKWRRSAKAPARKRGGRSRR